MIVSMVSERRGDKLALTQPVMVKLFKNWLAANPIPEEPVEPTFRLDLLPGPRIANGRFDLAAVPDNSGVGQQCRNLGLSPTGNNVRIETVKSLSEGIALFEDGDPGKPGLKAVENQFFPERAAVPFGHAPFGIVVIYIKGVFAAPPAPIRCA